MLCSPLIDRWQQMNPLLSLGANQTHRFTYSTDCVPQQRLLLLAKRVLQAAPQSEGQDFCICRKKCVFPHKHRTFAQTSHELNTSYWVFWVFFMFFCQLRHINSRTDACEDAIKAAINFALTICGIPKIKSPFQGVLFVQIFLHAAVWNLTALMSEVCCCTKT